MDPSSCESRIERVVVYARGAVVTRRVTLPADLSGDALDLRVPGITALAEPGSVRAIVDGDRAVVAVSSRLVLPEAEALQGDLALRLTELRLEEQRLFAARGEASAERDALASIRVTPAMARGARHVDPAARAADAIAAASLVDEEIEELDETIRSLDRAIEDNRRAIADVELRAAQAPASAIAGARRATFEVTVRLDRAGEEASLQGLSVEYVVMAARFWPAYSARFSAAATRVDLAIDAFVAQATGEDWERVALSLSTADLTYDARLPELRSLRIGRAQPPASRGYRPAPEGLEALFSGYDRAVTVAMVSRSVTVTETAVLASIVDAPIEAPKEAPMKEQYQGLRQQERAEADLMEGIYPAANGDMEAREEMSLTRAGSINVQAMRMKRRAKPSAPMPMPPPAGPMPPKSASLFGFLGGGGGGVAYAEEPSMDEPPSAIEPEDEWLDFDRLSLSDDNAQGSPSRGQLVRPVLTLTGIRGAIDRIERLDAPAHAVDPKQGRGRFDHRYDAAAAADIPSDERLHRVAVGKREAVAKPCFVTVPREVAEVYREVEIRSPFDAPLLAGPVDVFLDGALMTTSSIAAVDRRGVVRLGLGVEERLRVARNVRADEGSAGLLGGTTTIDHAVTIDLSSSLGEAASVEVLERVPVTDDKDIEIKIMSSKPSHELYDQVDRGSPIRRGVRFRVDVPPGETSKIELKYRVTLPSKNELVGGNRRD